MYFLLSLLDVHVPGNQIFFSPGYAYPFTRVSVISFDWILLYQGEQKVELYRGTCTRGDGTRKGEGRNSEVIHTRVSWYPGTRVCKDPHPHADPHAYDHTTPV